MLLLHFRQEGGSAWKVLVWNNFVGWKDFLIFPVYWRSSCLTVLSHMKGFGVCFQSYPCRVFVRNNWFRHFFSHYPLLWRVFSTVVYEHETWFPFNLIEWHLLYCNWQLRLSRWGGIEDYWNERLHTRYVVAIAKLAELTDDGCDLWW